MLTIYTKPNCPHCVEAKHYLSMHHIGYQEIDIANDGAALRFLLEQGHRTVPQLYADDHLLEGGNVGLRQLPLTELEQLSA